MLVALDPSAYGVVGERWVMQGLRDLLQQLRQQRRERLDRFDLGGVMDDIRKQLDEILDLERDTQHVLCDTEDFMEGTMAFLQKRKPKFTGK